MDIYTIGHSTHDKDTFVSMLKAHDIETLVDVRSYPSSRYCPHFNKENMEQWVTENNIRYLHMPELGGRRRKLYGIDESLVNGWTHVSFKNYAAYTFTDEYERGINKLLRIAEKERIAYFCSECLPWKCHRSIISNTLTALGINVYHIMNETKIEERQLGKYGAMPKIVNNKVIYPKQDVK